MAGFLRKVAGAFVHLEDDDDDKNASSKGSLDDITNDASELIAQLDASDTSSTGAGAEAAPGPGQPAQQGTSALMNMTADQVFTAAGLVDGPNSAPRVLKLLAGLSMFPVEQQVVMVRAMDAADESWSEAEVLEDARKRVAVLHKHLQGIDGEHSALLGQLNERIAATQAEGRALVDEIDKRIAELHKQREDALVSTTQAVNALTQEIHAIESSTHAARRGIHHVIQALSSLIGFFTGGQPPAPGR